MFIVNNFVKKKLKSVLSDYLESDNKTEISIQIMNEIKLKDMLLKKEKINEMMETSPFQMVKGSIGVIHLDMALDKLLYSPIKVTLEDIDLLLELKNPKEMINFNVKKELERKLKEYKDFVVQEITPKSDDKGFIAKIAEKIFDNLQFVVKRFKVVVSCPSLAEKPQINFGFNLFDFKTVNDQGEEIFFDRNKSIYKNLPINKQIRLEKMYLRIFQKNQLEQLQDEKKSKEIKKRIKQESKVFRSSLQISCKIKTDMSKTDQPKIDAFVEINQITFNFNQNQIINFLKIQNEISLLGQQYENFKKFQLSRPQKSIRELKQMSMSAQKYKREVQRWWVYAINVQIKKMMIQKRKEIFRKFYNITGQEKIKLTPFVINQYQNLIKDNLEYLVENDFNSVDLLKDPNNPLDLENMFCTLPVSQIINFTKIHCKDQLKRLKKKKSQMGTIKRIFSWVGLTSNQSELNQIQKVLEEKLEDQKESEFKIRLDLKLYNFTITFTSQYLTTFNFNFKQLFVNYSMFVNQMNAKVSFDEMYLSYINKEYQKPQNILGSKSKDFFKLQLQMNTPNKNYQQIMAQIKISSYFLAVKESLFSESKKMLKSFQNIKSEANLELGNITDKVSVAVKSQAYKQQQKVTEMNLNIDMAKTEYIVYFDEEKQLKFFTEDFDVIYKTNKYQEQEVSVRIMEFQILYQEEVSKEPYTLASLSCIGDIRFDRKMIEISCFFCLQSLVINFFPMAFVKLKKNIDDFMDHNDLFLYPASLFRMTLNTSQDGKNWKNRVFSLYDDKTVSISDFDKSQRLNLSQCKITYFNDKEDYVLKLTTPINTILIKFEDLDKIKQFTVKLFELCPEFDKKKSIKTVEKKEGKKMEISLEIFVNQISLNLYNEINCRLMEISLQNIFTQYNKDNVEINLDHFVLINHDPSNRNDNKLIGHIGKLSNLEEIFYLDKKIQNDEIYEEMNKTIFEDSIDIFQNQTIKKLNQSFFLSSLFAHFGKSEIEQIFQRENFNIKDHFIDKVFGVKVSYSFNKKDIDVSVDKILIFWNIDVINKIEEYANFTQNLIKNYFTPQPKSENSVSKIPEKPIEETQKKQQNEGEINVFLRKIIFLNCNQYAYQTEMIISELMTNIRKDEQGQHINLLIKRLEVNDLTQYPFTKKKFELFKLKEIKRKRIIDLKASPPNLIKIKDLQGKNQIKNLFKKNAIICEVLIKNLDQIQEDKIKTIASVFIHNLQINYHQQVIFRLIDLITVSLMGKLTPDIFPEKIQEIQKRITGAFKTHYNVEIYNIRVYLRPNYLTQKYLLLEVPTVFVSNENLELPREYLNKQKEYHVEQIKIKVIKFAIKGFEERKNLIESPEMNIVFTRFLFFRELEKILGLNYLLKNVQFGSDIEIDIPKLRVSFNKNNFFYLMTTLFNNVTYDDRQDSKFMQGFQVLKYGVPQDININIDDFLLEFRYDQEKQEQKSFLNMGLPQTQITINKNIKNERQIKITAKELTGFASEVNPENFNEVKTISFIRPLLNGELEDQQNDQMFVRKQSQRYSGKYDMKEKIDLHESFQFAIKMFMLPNGNKDILINFSGLQISLIPSLILQLLDTTKMTDEMSFNNWIMPIKQDIFGDMKMNLLMKNIFVLLPQDQEIYKNNLYLYLSKLDLQILKIHHQYSQKMDQRIQKYLKLNKYTVNSQEEQDNELLGLIKSYQVDKYVILESVMTAKLEDVDLIVIKGNQKGKIFDQVLRQKIRTNFNTDNFNISAKINNVPVRFLMNDLCINYETNTLSNYVDKFFYCTETLIDINSLDLAINTYDLDYLSSMMNYLNGFKFQELKQNSEAQKYVNGIIQKNSLFSQFQNNNQNKTRSIMAIKPLEFNFFIIDDLWSSGEPLLHFNLNLTKFQQINSHSVNELLGRITLESSYLNLTNHEREPILESFKVQLNKNYDIVEDQEVIKLDLLDKNTNLNISTDLINLMESLQQNVTHLKKMNHKKSIIERTQFFVNNQTGFDLQMCLQYDDRVEETFMILNEQKIAIKMKNRKNSIILKKVLFIKLSLIRKNALITFLNTDFDKNHLNTNIFIEKQQNLLTNVNVIVSLQKSNTQRILKLYSAHRLINKSGMDLQIKFCNKGVTTHQSLDNKKEINVPLDYVSGSFCVKFNKQIMGKQYQNYSSIYCLDEFRTKKIINVKNRVFLEIVQSKVSGKLHNITINSPLKIINCLMNDLKIKIEIPENQLSFELNFFDEENTKNVLIDISKKVLMTIEFLNFKSKQVELDSKKLFQDQKIQKMWLRDEKNKKKLKIYIKKQSGKSINNLYFYHQSLLQSEVFENWVFSQKLKGNNLLLTKIRGDGIKEPGIYYMKHNQDLSIKSLDFNMKKILVNTKSIGTQFTHVVENKSIKKEISIQTEMRTIHDDFQEFQKLIKIFPKYIFINETGSQVTLSHLTCGLKLTVEKGERKPLFTTSSTKENYVFKIKLLNSQWSEPIDLQRTGFQNFSVIEKGEYQMYHLYLETNYVNSSFYVILYAPEQGLYQIDNRMKDINVLIYQSSLLMQKLDYDFEVQAESKDEYSWRYPQKDKYKIYFQFIKKKSRKLVGFCEFHVDKNYNKIENDLIDQKIYLELKFNGKLGIIKIWQIGQEESFKFAEKLPMKQEKKVFVPSLGISLISGKMEKRKELMFLSVDQLQMSQRINKQDTQYHIKVNSLQIDYNSNYHTHYPILFSQLRSKYGVDQKEFLNVQFSTLNHKQANLTVISQLNVMVYPCFLKLEEKFINDIVDMVQEMNINRNNKDLQIELKDNNIVNLDTQMSWKANDVANLKPTYIQDVKISKIPLLISFKKQSTEKKDTDFTVMYGPILNALGVILANFENISINLPEVTLLHETNSLPVFKTKVIQIYKGIIFKVIFQVIGSANILGNPLNLYTEIKGGVNDLVHDTKTKGAKGIVTGTGALVQHTVGGTFTSVNKITRTLGDGISTLTVDQKYIHKRQKLYNKDQNKFFTGVQQLGLGFYDGIKGVVMKPIEGGQKKGFKGIISGTLKGFSGLITKPVTGILDLTSATADGFAHLIQDKKCHEKDLRKRPPRPFYSDIKLYKKYDEQQAKVTNLIPKKSKDGYHVILIEKINFELDHLIICLEGILILSNQKIQFRKNVENLIGSVRNEKTISIEYFDIVKEVQLHNIIIDIDNQAQSERIHQSIIYIIQKFNERLEAELEAQLN